MVGISVLIIDGDAVSAEVITVALESIAATCEVVADGRRAMDRLADEPADLVVLDVCLPRVSGLDVLRCLRCHPAWMATPVIVVTSCDAEELIVAALHADADDVLPKPLNIAELRARVARRLRARPELVAAANAS